MRPEDFRQSRQSTPRSITEQPQRAPAKTSAKPTGPTTKVKATVVKRGAKERPEWGAIVPHLKTLLKDGELPNRNAAFHAVKDWLGARTMASSTIYAGIDRHCADWWE
jgi:hypothetical protein